MVVVQGLLLSSCLIVEFKPNWDVNNTIPLVYATLNAQQTIKNTTFSSKNDTLWVQYESSPFSYEIDSLIEIPDTSTRNTFVAFFSGAPVAPNQTILFDTTRTIFDLGEYRLYELKIKRGTIEIEINNALGGPINIDFELPLAERNNQTYQYSTQVGAGNVANPATTVFTDNLDGYVIDLRGFNQILSNRLYAIVNAYSSPSASVYTMNSGDSLSIQYTIKDFEIEYVKGFVPNSEIQLNEQIEIPFLNQLQAEEFQLSNEFKAQINLKNYTGIDFELQLESIQANANSTPTNLVGYPLQTPIFMPRANLVQQQLSPSVKNIDLSTQNSNFIELLNTLPNSLNVNGTLEINPLGNISGGNDFIYTDQNFEGTIQVETPLVFQANQLTFTDTLNYTLGDSISTITKEANLIVVTKNKLPFSGELQLWAIHATTNVAYKIQSSSKVFFNASTNGAEEIQVVVINLPLEALQALEESSRLAFTATINTANANTVAVKVNQALEVETSIQINTEL